MSNTGNEPDYEARSPRGLAILKHAISDGGKILEFDQSDDGTILVKDITEHVNELEKQRNDDSEHEQQ